MRPVERMRLRELEFFFLKSVDLLLEWLLVLALTGGKWRE